jgi:hypothetical protein
MDMQNTENLDQSQIFDLILQEINVSQEELVEEAPAPAAPAPEDTDEEEGGGSGGLEPDEEAAIESEAERLAKINKIGAELAKAYRIAIRNLVAGGSVEGTDSVEDITDDFASNPRKTALQIAQALKVDPEIQNDIADRAQAFHYFQALAKGEKAGGGEGGTEEGGAAVDKDVPLSIFKRQKDQPGLKSAKGAWEMPLTAYLKKKLQLSDRSVQKIAKDVGKALKGKGLNIAEGKVHSIVSQIIEGRASRGELGSTREGDMIDALEKNLDSLKTKKDVLLFRNAIKKGKVPRGVGQVLKIDQSSSSGATPVNLEDNGIWVKKAQGWFLNYGGKKVIDDKLKAVESGGPSAGYDKRELYLKRKKRDGGLVGHIMYTYALRLGEKDPEFMKKFTADPKARDTLLKSVNKLLRRQMRRRGIADADIKNYLREAAKILYAKMLTEDIVSEIKKNLNA